MGSPLAEHSRVTVVFFVFTLVLLSLLLSSKTVRAALPFESLVAFGAVAVTALALFQFGKLG